MRLPFSSKKPTDASEECGDRRASISENVDPLSTSGPATGDDVSERSTTHSVTTPLDTPATSYSSYSSGGNDKQAKKTGMYKLSVVDGSGTFLPPSPTDHGKENGARAWSLHRKSQNKSRERVASADGPFIISRESFEGYRRSFDVGGTSPTLAATSTFANSPRLSLDSNLSTRNGSISSRTGSRLRPSIAKVEEQTLSEAPFEDVRLEDEDKTSRRTILSRFGFGQRVSATAAKKRDGEELQSFKTET